jgi:dTDP-4-dehydrorhamnose reductase
MRILVTGRDGQVGWEVQRALQAIGDVVAVGRQQLDFADLDNVRERLDSIRPDVIVNSAAYTAVDKAETEEEVAFLVNARAPELMAGWAARNGAAMIHYSTDYVFSGNLDRPYTESDPTEPLSAYGRSKLAGERAVGLSGCAHAVLRTSWVYATRGRNFLRTMSRLAVERDELRVVNDQVGAPTWARSIAEATAALIARASAAAPTVAAGLRDRGGIFHVTCGGAATWYEFASEIVRRTQGARAARIVPISTAEYPTPARRPANSRLSCDKLEQAWQIRLPEWDAALAMCMEAEGEATA